MMNAISIILASRTEKDRDRILGVLSEQSGFFILSVEKDETSTIIRSAKLKPDIIIIDLQPAGISVPELAVIILRKTPDTSIIIMCDKDENDYAVKVLNAGIRGLLIKNTDMDKLIHVIKIVHLGGIYVSASINKEVFNTIALYRRKSNIQLAAMRIIGKPLCLSPTERSIIKYLVLGLSDEAIARLLHYSTGSIRNAITALKRKTNFKNRMQIVAFSLLLGEINLDNLPMIQYNEDTSV